MLELQDLISHSIYQENLDFPRRIEYDSKTETCMRFYNITPFSLRESMTRCNIDRERLTIYMLGTCFNALKILYYYDLMHCDLTSAFLGLKRSISALARKKSKNKFFEKYLL